MTAVRSEQETTVAHSRAPDCSQLCDISEIFAVLLEYTVIHNIRMNVLYMFTWLQFTVEAKSYSIGSTGKLLVLHEKTRQNLLAAVILILQAHTLTHTHTIRKEK